MSLVLSYILAPSALINFFAPPRQGISTLGATFLELGKVPRRELRDWIDKHCGVTRDLSGILYPL